MEVRRHRIDCYAKGIELHSVAQKKFQATVIVAVLPAHVCAGEMAGTADERWRPELPVLQKHEQMEWQALSNRNWETARAKNLIVIEHRESVALGRKKGR